MNEPLSTDAPNGVDVVFADGKAKEFPGIEKVNVTASEFVLYSTSGVEVVIPKKSIKYIMTGENVSLSRAK